MAAESQWPPPLVKELVLAELPDHAQDAEWPSPRTIDLRTRALGRQLQEGAQPVEVRDRYDIFAISSRGGLEVANKLCRVFNFSNPNIRFVGLTSYEQKGTERGHEFLHGHMPLQEDIEGQDVLLVDEVCDTGNSQLENFRILKEELGAATVTSAVIDFKPGRSQATGFVPDFYVYTTERWIVYPWEVYELLGERALDETIWLPESAQAALASSSESG